MHMNLRTVIISATTAALLATSGVALAGAASNPSSNSPTAAVATAASTGAASPNATARTHHGQRARLRIRRAIRRGAARVITETVGIDRKTLRADLLGGQTIADIAKAHNVDPQTIITTLVTKATTRLDAAATAGRITTARAKRIEAKLPTLASKIVNTWLPKRARTTTP